MSFNNFFSSFGTTKYNFKTTFSFENGIKGDNKCIVYFNIIEFFPTWNIIHWYNNIYNMTHLSTTYTLQYDFLIFS